MEGTGTVLTLILLERPACDQEDKARVICSTYINTCAMSIFLVRENRAIRPLVYTKHKCLRRNSHQTRKIQSEGPLQTNAGEINLRPIR